MNKPIKQIVQVVKRFGLCGGMEEYVYQLSKELKSAGQNILILCEEKVSCPNDLALEVVELEVTFRKPRWLSHLLFSKKVKNWIDRNPLEARIIHSHERISCHHVTTIHSTLFNFPPKGFPSFRKYMNNWLERREITRTYTQEVIPVSYVIRDQVTSKFPAVIAKLSDPINPGVKEIKLSPKIKESSGVKTIGFFGNEWKRKGLSKVISIWRVLNKSDNKCSLILAGFDVNTDIGLSIEEKKQIQNLGWLHDKAKFYSKIDLLIHPAEREAYGMVIPEALSLGIPVLCSKECGAASVITKGQGAALAQSESNEMWAKAATDLLNAKYPKDVSYERPWSRVANEYMKFYRNINFS